MMIRPGLAALRAWWMILALLLGGCAAQPAAQPVDAGSAQPAKPAEYRLGSGDQIHLTTYGEDDLSGLFTVDGAGMVRLPLIGEVSAAGLTVPELEDGIARKLSQGYLKDPKISIQVMSHRPFYILGEIKNPGEYPYVNNMTVLNAVAVAGGFTYRAKTSTVYIRHAGSGDEIAVPATGDTPVGPGDVVRVAERFF